jgi:hypothetical protein
MMYASLISFFCCAEALNCLWMLARRCCGREAILIDVRRAEDDMAFSKEGNALYDRGSCAERVGSSESNYHCHMAATFRSFMRSTGSWLLRNVGKRCRGLRGRRSLKPNMPRPMRRQQVNNRTTLRSASVRCRNTREVAYITDHWISLDLMPALPACLFLYGRRCDGCTIVTTEPASKFHNASRFLGTGW